MFATTLRTHTCGGLRRADEGRTVSLVGWVHARRDHGGLLFVDLRDRYGLTQVVIAPESAGADLERLRGEDVIRVTGPVRARPDGMVNPALDTGEVEVVVEAVEVLGPADTPPIEIEDDLAASEDLRLKYRYLDLRRPKMQRTFQFRHRFFLAIRNFLDERGFLEIETPILTKSTPEGARDYLVPSRVKRGSFYALPQSPQLFKQILMLSGYDRYAQIAKCFRDEDLRANRQPEFTQLDMEMAFVAEEDVFEVFEALCIGACVRDVLGREVVGPFPRMTYDDAMARYGSDKPDLRFGLELADLSGHRRRLPGSRCSRGPIEAGGHRQGTANSAGRVAQPQGDRRAREVREGVRREGARVVEVDRRRARPAGSRSSCRTPSSRTIVERLEAWIGAT